MSAHSIILGIGGALGHDANAALLVDGRLIASAQEERYSRIKHDGTFPRRAMADCLAIGNLAPSDITDVVFAEKSLQSHLFNLTGNQGNAFTRMLGRVLPEGWANLYGQQARELLPHANFHHAWHHLSHVAGAFYTSPFEQAAFLCVDGKGEDMSASAGTISHDELSIHWEQSYENGLGMFYTLITYYLGFLSVGSEYKVMGLAPYGTPRYVAELSRLFSTDDRGGLRLKRPVRFTWDSMMQAIPWVAQVTGFPQRGKSDSLDERHIDLAASLQLIFEQELFKMARFLQAETGATNILFCGGCAQNCVAAGKLRTQGIFKNVFNSPVGGDMGSGLGAALLYERERRGKAGFKIDPRGFGMGSEPGPAPDSAEPFRVPYTGSLHTFVAGELAAGKIVAVVRGGMELGARALGARSILADPRAPGMQSRLNLAVKFRESFRPFAPAILAAHVGEWFDSDAESDYMNYTAYLKPELRVPMPTGLTDVRARLDFPRCSIPSVIHVDFSARLQTVRPSVHPDFHHFISAFHALTGIPILINTSFNVAGQPIVRTAAEGWDCFVNTDIDLLVLNDDVFQNPFQKTRTEKLAWLNQFEKSS
jgi:carbamoyltransferase